MLEIAEIKLKNFLSYGDYDTIISFKGLGTTLITGEIDNESINQADFNNGAGKSTLPNAILWCLFGRTMHTHNPGDKVINFFTKKDCCVEIKFVNGDKLTRTRNVNGHNDLLLIKNGEDVSLGTTTMQQESLNRELGLDWDIFCGSTFFSQFGKSWMEMSDQKRRQALEREFHLDRIVLYSEVAKEKAIKTELEQSKLQDTINNNRLMIDNFNTEVKRLGEAAAKFEETKRARIKNAQITLKELERSRDEIELIDLNNLQNKWNKINEAIVMVNENQQDVEKINKKIQLIRNEINKYEAEIIHLRLIIANWKKQKGKICISCEQIIPNAHIISKIKTPIVNLTTMENEHETIKIQMKTLENDAGVAKIRVRKLMAIIESKKPSITIRQAKTNNVEYNRRCENVKRQIEQIKQIRQETNSYEQLIVSLKEKIKDHEKGIKDITKKIEKFDKLLRHINYVHRAYSDRRKIKSYILQEYIPYLNERIAHYLDKFNLDLKMEFTNALGIKSNMWGYDFCSGGERKRMDVAIMLALLDLHSVMYGRQCNVVVFDEAERSLDGAGISTLIDIIKEEIADKVDAVLIIAHNNQLKGTFQSEIEVIREDRFSKINKVLN